MNDDHFEILSAFVDGENVDPQELARTLQLPGALDSLRQFVELRAGVQEIEELPGDEFYAAMERVMTSARDRKPWWRRAIPVPMPALAAASLAVIAVALWIGPRGPSTGDFAGRPPEPDRIVHFEPGVDWQFPDSEPQTRERRMNDGYTDDTNDPYRRDRFALALASGDDLAVLERRRRHDAGI